MQVTNRVRFGIRIEMSDRTDIERVREAVSLVTLISEFVPLQQKGSEWVGVCPFHDDHKPSMRVVTNRSQEFYKCFSCGAGGDCFNFVQEYLKKDFVEALRFLAERHGIELSNRKVDEDFTPRSTLRKAMQWTMEQYIAALSTTPEGANALEQLHARGFTDESIEQFSIGVAPKSWSFITDKLQGNVKSIEIGLGAGIIKKNEEKNRVYDAFRHRIMFPILDESGSPIAFGGRRLDEEDEPKYINSPETTLFHKSKTLYGYKFARKAIQDSKVAVVVEGYTDVIACHQAGVTNVVATLGTALTSEHADILSRVANEVVLVFDGDNAGQAAADRAVEIFFKKNIDIQICVLPEGEDPADLASVQGQFEQALSESVDALEYKFNRLDNSLAVEDTISGKARCIELFMNELARLGVDALKSSRKALVYEKIARLLKIPMDEVSNELKTRKPALRRESPITDSPATEEQPVVSVTISKARQLAEREFISVLLFDATEASAVLRDSDHAITPEDFMEQSTHTLAIYMLPKLMAGTLFSIHEIGDDLGEQAKDAAMTYYLLGERICQENGSVLRAIEVTNQALQNVIQNQSIRAEVKNVHQEMDESAKEKAAQQAINSIRRKQSTRSAS